MPRRNGVYRTIRLTEVKATCLDLKKGEPIKESFIIPHETDKEKIYKDLRRTYDSSKHKLVHISSLKNFDVKYFITLKDFLKVATPEREVKIWQV